MKKDTTFHHVARAGLAILNYLREHPKAEDTVAGIAQWWVGEEKEAVEKALSLLVKDGVMEQRGNTYRIAREHTGDEGGIIFKFLK